MTPPSEVVEAEGHLIDSQLLNMIFDKVIERKDTSWEAYIERGRTKAALGDGDGALLDLTEAIDLQPSFPDGYYQRAEYY